MEEKNDTLYKETFMEVGLHTKRHRCSQKQRVNQLRNTANYIKAIKQNKPTRKVLIPIQHEITENIYIEGPHLPDKAFCIVEPIHIISLRTTGVC